MPMKNILIPGFLSHLPVYRGYPVPYFVPIDENGVYQFKFASQEKMNACIRYHKYCICFKPLNKKDYWFISGPIGLQNQVDSHPAMHRHCAEYSLQICPHLFFEKAQRTTDVENAMPYQITEKPKQLVLVRAKKTNAVSIGAATVIRYSSHEVITRYEYQNGTLTELNLLT